MKNRKETRNEDGQKFKEDEWPTRVNCTGGQLPEEGFHEVVVLLLGNSIRRC